MKLENIQDNPFIHKRWRMEWLLQSIHGNAFIVILPKNSS